MEGEGEDSRSTDGVGGGGSRGHPAAAGSWWALARCTRQICDVDNSISVELDLSVFKVYFHDLFIYLFCSKACNILVFVEASTLCLTLM